MEIKRSGSQPSGKGISWLGEVIEDDGVTIPLVIPRQRGETQLEIKDVTLHGRRYVLCRNE
jgi:hypothetical protein